MPGQACIIFSPFCAVPRQSLRFCVRAAWLVSNKRAGAGWANQTNKHVAWRAKRLDPARSQDEELIHGIQNCRSLRDDYNGNALLFRAQKCVGQRLLAGGIEIGIRLIKNNEGWIAKERTS